MNAQTEKPEGSVPHNPKLPMLAAEHMGKKLVELHLQELRVAPDVWQKMSEKQQQESIERIQHGVKYAVAGAVNTIVTGGHTALAGTIESIAKKDKIKLTVIIDRNNNSDAMHEFYLADSGASCQILMADAAQYLGSMDLVEADPDQGQLFGSNGASLPDDAFLWAINLPIMSGGASMIPAPSRKDAELFARSIREKLYEMDQVEYAKSVYAHLWPLNNGEHMRSFNKGNWEAMINWFGQLCKGEVDVAPVALIGHSPKQMVKPETMTMHYDRVMVTMNDGTFVAVGEFSHLPDDEGYEEENPKVGYGISVEMAVHNLLNQYDIQGTFTLKDESTPADEVTGRRVIDVYLTFDPLVHPDFVQEANLQHKEQGMNFDQVVEEILHEMDYKDSLVLDTYVVTKQGMDFVALSFAKDVKASSPISVEAALKARAAMEELTNVEFSFAECTTGGDEARGRRLFDVTCTFNPIEHPVLAHAAQEQLADLAIDMPEAKMGGMIDSFIEQEWPSESVATDDEVTAEKPKGRAVKPRYSNPETGETWTGRGKQPAWLVAKIAEGASIDDFLIQ